MRRLNSGTAEEVLARWVDALGGTTGVPRGDIEAKLAESARQLLAALTDPEEGGAPGSRLACGRGIGAALVAARYRDPVVITRTLKFINHDVAVKTEAPPDVVVALCGEVAAGFAAALRETALTEQESVLGAALAAAQAAEGRRHLSEARFDAVFAGTSVGIATVDRSGLVTNANAAMAAMLGRQPQDIRGHMMAEVMGRENLRAAFADFQRLLAGEISHFRTDTEHLRPDGGVTSIDLTMSSVRGPSGEVDFLIGITVDVTARNQLSRSLWHEAHHDSLTGLPNRSLFFQRLRAAKYPLGVCYLDLDGFKRVNDGGGHAAGDEVLRVVAERLRTALERVGRLRKSNTPVDRLEATAARLGGDEFVVLLENCGERDLATLATELIARLASPAGWLAVPVSASIGVVHETVRGPEDELMMAADDAMYRAKAAGGNQWCT